MPSCHRAASELDEDPPFDDTHSCSQAGPREDGTFQASVATGEMLTILGLCREQSGSSWM